MRILELFESAIPSAHGLCEPYLIAEAGVNHGGNLDLAKRLIDEALEGGADAVKFQTYRAETIAVKASPAYWDTTLETTSTQYELFKKYDRFWKPEFEALKQYCDAAGVEFLSTPFDTESAAFLSDLMDVFKISSSDITNKPFIEYICAFGKPIILSTGASFLHEIETALLWIERFGNKVALLHCVLNYPTEDANANLGMITDLRARFPDRIIGYSDHTLPADMQNLETATLLGARILEKHFTHDKSLPGNDHYHAMDKEDIKLFRRNMKRVFVSLGSFSKSSLPSEEPARRHARRSLVASRFIPRGKVIEASDLTWKRPASGVSPSEIERVVGRVASDNIHEDEILTWEKIR